MTDNSGKLSDDLIREIISFCRHIARPREIHAVFADGGLALGIPRSESTLHVSVIIPRFQARLMNYIKVVGKFNIFVMAVDKWVFERDVDRGFLGEALSGGLIFAYRPLVNEAYLHSQELRLKRRLAVELLENLVIDFPEFSYGFYIRPEYFPQEIMFTRARLFPTIIYTAPETSWKSFVEKETHHANKVFLEAINELEKTGILAFSEGYIRLSEKFVDTAKGQKTKFVNLLRTGQRTLFMSVLAVFPRMMNILSQSRGILLRLRSDVLGPWSRLPLEDPLDYVFVPTATGLAPLANRMDIEKFAREVLRADKDAEVKIDAIGGILNDVFLVKTLVRGQAQKMVVKRFRDWSSLKWFPLTLWSLGTRTFAVLANSRLEKECAINQLLDSKGFAVPKILYVSPNGRLLFKEYVEGEDLRKVVKRIAGSGATGQISKDLEVIGKAGVLLARTHSIDVALGDTKPENMLVGAKGKIYLTDLEQAGRGGDKVWDIAEFLYYAGHDASPLAEIGPVQRMAEAFIRGYLKAGGELRIVKRAGDAKYTKVFSVFTFPHIILAISNVCRNAEKIAM